MTGTSTFRRAVAWNGRGHPRHTGAGPATRRTGQDDNVLKQYVWGIRYIDAPICRAWDPDCDNSGWKTTYYLNDANFNVTALVETDGDVVERYAYDPYGKPTVLHGVADSQGNDTSGSEWSQRTSNTFDNEILFCGYRYDSETGLYHVRNRMYHTTLGRWSQRDPIGYADGMSLYEYVRGDPTSLADPMGLSGPPTYEGNGNWLVDGNPGTPYWNPGTPYYFSLASCSYRGRIA